MSAKVIELSVEFQGKTTMIITNENATIDELNRQASEIVFKGELTPEDFYLVYNGEPLEKGSETVKTLNMKHMTQLGYLLRLHGGSSSSLEPLPGYISTTSSEPCSISLDNDPNEKRAKMPCKCVISVASMIEYCNRELKTGNFRFFCSNCKGKEWQYFLVRHVLSAEKTDEELREIDAAVNKNFMKSSGMQQCPFCKSYCKRDVTKKFYNRNRVVCPLCSKRSGREVEFCWCCLESWRGNMESCGNAGCDGTDPRCRYLIGCPKKKIDDQNVDVPSVRGCVKCGNLISHKQGCKHMSCRCGYDFCFVCLKPYNKNKKLWECGHAYAKCPVAPRQKHLDETFASSAASEPIAQSSSDESRCIII